jgi:hypothetical protein
LRHKRYFVMALSGSSGQEIVAHDTEALCAAIRRNDRNFCCVDLCELRTFEPDFTRPLGEALLCNSHISSITIGTNNMGMSNEFRASNVDAINSPLPRFDPHLPKTK